MDIKRVNLNLLVHFNTLYNHRSVSLAAKHSFISQTAMSHILRQLRELFDDPLFIRKSIGIRPTKKAMELAPQIADFINNANTILKNDEFIPEHNNTNFNIALSAYGEHLVLSKLCLYLKEHAPNVTLNVIPISAGQQLDELLEDYLDFAIAPGFVNISDAVMSDTLLLDKAVCIAPVGVYDKERFNQQAFLAAEHIDVQFSDAANRFLHQRIDFYSKRMVRFRVSNVMSGLEIIEGINCIMTIPLLLAERLQEKYQFDILPFPKEQSFQVKIFYNKRMLNYKPLEWMIGVLQTLLENKL